MNRSRRSFLKSLLFLPFLLQKKILPATPEYYEFAQISDVHLTSRRESRGRRLFAHSEMLLHDALEQICNKGVKRVIFSGDSIDGARLEGLTLFKKIISQYPLNYFILPGNHDLGCGHGVTREHFKEMIGETAPLKSRIAYQRKINEDLHFIFLDGVDNSKITANGYFGNEQIEWLDATLKELNRPHPPSILIFCHYPIFAPFRSRSHECSRTEREALTGIISKYPFIRCFIHGHYHCCRIQQSSNCWHIASPALVEYPNAFRIFRVQDGGIHVGFTPTRHKQLALQSRNRCRWQKTNLGRAEDRNHYII